MPRDLMALTVLNGLSILSYIFIIVNLAILFVISYINIIINSSS